MEGEVGEGFLLLAVSYSAVDGRLLAQGKREIAVSKNSQSTSLGHPGPNATKPCRRKSYYDQKYKKNQSTPALACVCWISMASCDKMEIWGQGEGRRDRKYETDPYTPKLRACGLEKSAQILRRIYLYCFGICDFFVASSPF